MTIERATPLRRIAELLYYVRTTPDADTSVAALARYAGFSPFHFQRVFRVIVGETVGDYLRSRRLQRAAADLRASEKTVTEIALGSGYETASAFTRAFASAYGVSPSTFRTGEETMTQFYDDVRIEELAPMRLLGIRRNGPYTNVNEAWQRLVQHGLERGIFTTRTPRVGLSWDDPQTTDASVLRYAACIVSDAAADDVLEEVTIEEGRWAIYRHVGPYELIGPIFDRLLNDVIARRELELRHAPAMELYRNNPRVVAPGELITNLALPIT